LRQRWSLLRRGDVGAETIPSSSADWWRASEASFLDPPLFAAFLERSDGAWSVEGWVVSGDARRKASGSYESSGADPGLLRGELALDPASRRFLLVRQRTEARAPSPHAQLFFSNLEGPFSEPASLRFPLVADGSWRTYVLDLADTSWPAEGRITALRYDPLESRGSFDLEVLALLPETPELAAFASGARRARLARRFLRGHGAEFGALQNPLPLPENAHAFYVDALTHATARRHYPELDGQPLVRPGIVSNVEHLALRSGALDFAIANHLLEHAKDPIGALQELVRAVRPGGVVFASVPDVGNPLDRLRTVTPTEHLIADHEQRRDRSADDLAHYREAIASGHPEMASAALEELIRERIAIAESIHFHTFDEVSFRWLLDRVAADVEVEHFVRSPMGGWDEYIAILRRRRHTERAGT
jgi:SAM-dependent methyltransferase